MRRTVMLQGDVELPETPEDLPPAASQGVCGSGCCSTRSPVADNEPAAHPPAERARGRSGTVVLRVAVDRPVLPGEVDVLRSSRSPGLDAAAVRAVQGWRFEPAMVDGEPAADVCEITIEFRLH